MGAAFILLAHANLDRAGALARALIHGGARVAAHLDSRVKGHEAELFLAGMEANPNAIVLERRAAEWGMMGLVDAALDGASALLQQDADWSHAMLISGADLPLRPLAELNAFLGGQGRRDFIEAHPADGPRWIKGGLQEERFTLHHLISYRRHPRLFDALVTLQRRLGVQRAPPPIDPPLQPQLGGQWWCLSRETLTAILNDPELPRLRRWFRDTWIPDESFFQTMAERHGRDLAGHGLTLATFNAQGRPHVLYDDHADALAGCSFFFARKADPRAEGLYRRFLGQVAGPVEHAGFSADPADNPILEQFAAADARALGPSTAPPGQIRWRPRPSAPAPYTVIWAEDETALERVGDALRGRDEFCLHGRTFHPERLEIAPGMDARIAYEAHQTQVRDHRPADFLSNLIHAAPRPRPVIFLVPEDGAQAEETMILDASAHWILLGRSAARDELIARLDAENASYVSMDAEGLLADPALIDPQKV